MLLPVSYPTKREWEHVRDFESESVSKAKVQALRLRHEKEKACLFAQHQRRFEQFEDDRYVMHDESTVDQPTYDAQTAREAVVVRNDMVNEYENLSMRQISENLGHWKVMEKQGLGGSTSAGSEGTTKANNVLKSAMRK